MENKRRDRAIAVAEKPKIRAGQDSVDGYFDTAAINWRVL